jgi:hypothetical protein
MNGVAFQELKLGYMLPWKQTYRRARLTILNKATTYSLQNYNFTSGFVWV